MKFYVLGALEVHERGEVVPVDGARQKRLLALMLINLNRALSVQQIQDELWETPPTSARQQIHNALGALRRVLSKVSGWEITTHPFGYQLEGPETDLDLHVFQSHVRSAEGATDRDAAAHLCAALELWRGPLLVGLDTPSISSAARRFEDLRLTASESLMALRLREGQASAVVDELHALVTANPYRELLRHQLMTALYLCGRQADALVVYEQGRVVLNEELGIDPGEHLRSLHVQILRGTLDSSASGPKGATELDRARRMQAGESRIRAHCSLPNDTLDFSGRSAELDRLIGIASQEESNALVISAIDGMGGVGKTTLAIRLAHRLTDEYPDGQYYIDLHGFSPGMAPVKPEIALASLLSGGGVPAEVLPPTLEARSALWRSHMAGKRALLVLDNVADAVHVRALLPGTAGILVVITSRRKLADLDGAKSLSLDVLPLDDAICLFTAIVGADRAQAEPAPVKEAVDLCGRLPLAVRLASARLRDRRAWTVEHLVDRLRDATQRRMLLADRTRDLMAALKVSYQHLNETQKHLFRSLAHNPGADFDFRAAAALADVDAHHTEYLLEQLLDDNLLRQDEVGRYYFHDLIREAALSLVEEHDDESGRDAALSRLGDYFLSAIEGWCAELSKEPPAIDALPRRTEVEPDNGCSGETRVLMAKEMANIAALVHATADAGLHEYSLRLADAVYPYLKTKNFEGAREIFERGLASAESCGDRVGEFAMIRRLVATVRERGTTVEALDLVARAIVLSRELGDMSSEVVELTNLGIIKAGAGDLNAAYDAFLRAQRLGDSVPDLEPKIRAAILSNLGAVCRDTGRLDQAEHHLQAALREQPSGRRQADIQSRTMWNIGMVQHLRNAQPEALRTFAAVRELSEQKGFVQGIALAYLGSASAHRALGDPTIAIDHAREALEIARRQQLRYIECESLLVIGEANIASGKLGHSRDVFGQALAYASEYDLSRYTARAWEGLAHLAWVASDCAKAKQLWLKAIDLYPAGMMDAEFARVHLKSEVNESAHCFRCSTRMPVDTRSRIEPDRGELDV